MSGDIGNILLALLGVAIIAVGAYFKHSPRKRKPPRASARPAPVFPPEWRDILRAKLPLYSRMPDGLRSRVEPLTQKFIERVPMVGCDGLTVTDGMRLVIATQACLLICGQDGADNLYQYGELRSVLIYPGDFVIHRQEEDEAGVVSEFGDEVSGESQATQRIVLSWSSISEPAPEGEIVNVVLHEFAHYLDSSTGGDFTDLDAESESLQEWHAVLEREFNDHTDAVEREEDTLIHEDGAENPSEFFAYSTEVFFEAPKALRERHPRLYDALTNAYRLDPAAW